MAFLVRLNQNERDILVLGLELYLAQRISRDSRDDAEKLKKYLEQYPECEVFTMLDPCGLCNHESDRHEHDEDTEYCLECFKDPSASCFKSRYHKFMPVLDDDGAIHQLVKLDPREVYREPHRRDEEDF